MAVDDRRIAQTIASEEIGARPDQVSAAAALLDTRATVPFVARYRKEATGGLDDTQLRSLADRLVYLREIEARRAAILASIREQEKLTPELEASIALATTKAAIEDLYLPYKPKRRTRAVWRRDERRPAASAGHRQAVAQAAVTKGAGDRSPRSSTPERTEETLIYATGGVRGIGR
jgi:transcriptional accessory protein Tex/SPT6